MKKLFPSGQFKKDYKRHKYNQEKIDALRHILNLLINEQPIPSQYKPHMLRGEYHGCMEYHIHGDYLLIWYDASNDIIELIRLGSHSELFR